MESGAEDSGDLAATLPAIGVFYVLYREVKRQRPDAIVFTKLRDGYLSFQEDAQLLGTFLGVRVVQREQLEMPKQISACFIPNAEMEQRLTQLDALHKPIVLADKQPGGEIEMLRIEPEVQRTIIKPYQVAAYHHFENGFDEKLDYATLEEAEAAAQGYVNGTMEDDGFAYDGAAVYNTETLQCLRIYGNYPDERAQEQAAAFAQERDAHAMAQSLPPFLNYHLIEANLLDDGGRKHKRQKIFEYFQSHKSLAERAEFLKNSYNDIWVEVLTDDIRTGYHAEQDGLLMWEGSYLSRTSESVFSWSVIAEMTEGLIERGEYKIKLGLQNAPVMAEQLALFDMGNDAPVYETPADAPSGILAPARAVPQAVIDQALYTGGNEPNSAERITVFYVRERPEQENIEFLRREFGTENGRGIEYEGRKYAVWFLEDGIHLAQGDSIRTGYSKTVVTWE